MFDYFGYGSNLDPVSLRVKGVEPLSSRRGTLVGWRLRFNIAHFFRHEGGVANIERTGAEGDRVEGVVHRLQDGALEALDRAEAYPDGYDRATVTVETVDGEAEAMTYVGTPDFIDDSCLPSRRYLNIVVRGAEHAGLSPSYVDQLRHHPVLPARRDPPFEHPPGEHPTFTAITLAEHPEYTALDDAVFDMSEARAEHRLLRARYGGRDMTAYHLNHLDTSDGTEEGVAASGRTSAQRAYLNTFLHSYAEEYRYVGRFVSDPALADSVLAEPGLQPYARYGMRDYPEALPHGAIEEAFPDVYFVTGQMATTFPEFPDVPWVFNRNMIIVREDSSLTLVNSVRLDEVGLGALEALGEVKHLVRIGALHDRDDPFYVDRYHPTFWAARGIEPDGLRVDRRLEPAGDTPFAGCTVFEFTTTALPESILVIDRAGGIAVACDALQNWVKPDEYFSDETVELMGTLGFWQPANIGPLFALRSQPKAEDYQRLLALPFRHALCGHGEPLRETAHEDYAATVERTFAS